MSPANSFSSPAPSPRDCAVVLVGHGSSRRQAAVACLHAHAATLGQTRAFAEVYAIPLAGGGEAPGEILDRITAPTVVIVPMMMCDGWSVRTATPQALGPLTPAKYGDSRRYLLCDPVGIHPAIADIIVARAMNAAEQMAVSPASSAVILIGHGSTKNRASQEATELQAARVRARGLFRAVDTAYLEQPPSLAEQLRQSGRPVVLIGFFAAPGFHATADVEAAMADEGGAIAYTGAVGTDAAIPAVIATMIADRLASEP